jgi:hypothetical protein
MRIIGELDYKEMKITVFKMNDKVSIKLEMHLMEQTYKFRDGSRIESMEDAMLFLNETFLDSTIQTFETMYKHKVNSLMDMAEKEGFQFPKII